VWPGLDERLWNRARDAECAAAVEAGGYAAALADVAPSRGATDRPGHVVVIPMDGPDNDSWKVAGGNFFYEIAQAAREYAGAEKVSIFAVDKADEPACWQLIRYLIDSGATHVIAGREATNRRTWDILWSQLAHAGTVSSSSSSTRLPVDPSTPVGSRASRRGSCSSTSACRWTASW
jgi:hypothetical protein